jgi:signal transduction histidine kinase
MLLPSSAHKLTPELLTSLVSELVRSRPQSPLEELERQNCEMLHTLEELRRRQLDLENADRRKNEFLTMLAHELRNPLATISMSVELMRRKKNFSLDDLAVSRESIGRQAAKLTRHVNDLLDVSRLTQGKVDLQKEPTEVMRWCATR